MGDQRGGRELNTLINFDHFMDLKEKFYIFSYGFGVKEPIITIKIMIQSFLSWEMLYFHLLHLRNPHLCTPHHPWLIIFNELL